MTPGDNPYVGASEFRNGITDYVGNPTTFPGHALSVPYDGSIGFACYQAQSFLASDAVQVLIPLQEVSMKALLAVCAVIRMERYRFNYGRKWHLARMKESTIRLPEKEGKPDWELLDAYITSLPCGGLLGQPA